MTFNYKTKGTCSRNILIEIDKNIIKSVTFDGGCNGNSKGIGVLVQGMDIKEVISKVKGIKCGFKHTSCPDQLALALEKYLVENIE